MSDTLHELDIMYKDSEISTLCDGCIGCSYRFLFKRKVFITKIENMLAISIKGYLLHRVIPLPINMNLSELIESLNTNKKVELETRIKSKFKTYFIFKLNVPNWAKKSLIDELGKHEKAKCLYRGI